MPSVAQKTQQNHAEGSVSHANDGAALASALDTTSFDALRNALSSLRSAVTLKSYEERPNANDEKIRCAKAFLSNAGLHQLHRVWTSAEDIKQTGIVSLVLHCLAGLIELLSFHQPDHSLAEQIILELLPGHGHGMQGQSGRGAEWHRMQAYLSDIEPSSRANEISGRSQKSVDRRSGSNGDLVLAALHLIHAITSSQSSKYARTVFDAMPWGMRSLGRLSNMRRRVAQTGKKNERKQKSRGFSVSTLNKPDIRTMWTLVLLSFLRSPSGVCTPISLRITALSTAREHYGNMLKGLPQDPAQIVTHTLLGLHDGLLSDEACVKLPRSKIVSLFNEWACKSLLELYERESDIVQLSNTEDSHSIADVIHHFMLALCTHPGRGVCYTDNGWYGRPARQDGGEDTTDALTSTKIDDINGANAIDDPHLFNKILFGVLKSLSPTRSVKQAELALRIMQASSELVGPYLATITPPTPKATSLLWLTSSSFLGRTLAVPLPGFQMEGIWQSSPPPIKACMDALLPMQLTRALFQRGLALTDRLAVLATLSLLARMLARLIAFKHVCEMASDYRSTIGNTSSVANDKVDSQQDIPIEDILAGTYAMQTQKETEPWAESWRHIATIARERLPEATSILASIDASNTTNGSPSQNTHATDANITFPPSSVTEQALRCVWLLQLTLGNDSTITGADLEKLFSFCGDDEASDETPNGPRELASLHAMRAIKATFDRHGARFDFLARTGAGNRSTVNRLLRIQASSSGGLLQEPARELIGSIMRTSLLFEHDPEEWQVWQRALEAPPDILIDFIDECSQRCVKTIYRYIEMARLPVQSGTILPNDLIASPLLLAMLEQFNVRMHKGLLADSRLPQSVVDLLSRLLPALTVQGSPCSAFTELLADCKVAVRQSKHAEADALIHQVGKTTAFVAGLDLGEVRRIPGQGGTKSAGQQRQSSLSPLAYARDLVTTSGIRAHGIKWEDYTEIDAKLVFLAVAAHVRSNPSSATRLTDVTLQALVRGACDAAFLTRTVFQQAYIVFCCKQKDTVELLINVVTRGPFQSDVEFDRALVNPLNTEVIGHLDGAERSDFWWSAAGRLAPFMHPDQQDKMLHIARATRPIPKDALLAIGCLTIARNSDADLLPLIESVDDNGLPSKRVISSLLRLFSRSSQSDDVGANELRKLVSCILQETKLPYREVDAVLCSILDRYPDIAQQVLLEIAGTKDNEKGLFNAIPATVAKWLRSARWNEVPTALQTELIEGLFYLGDATLSASSCKILERLLDDAPDSTWPILLSLIDPKPGAGFATDPLLLAASIDGNDKDSSMEFCEALVRKSLLWLVRRFAEDDADSQETCEAMDALTVLLCNQPALLTSMAHLVEPVLIAGIRRRLDSPPHARFLHRLLVDTPLKQTARQTYLVELLSNREALSIESIRHEVISTVCECLRVNQKDATPVVLAEIVRLYNGSLSLQDRQIFHSMSIFEEAGDREANILAQWHSSRGLGSQARMSGTAALLALDADRVLQSCMNFPRNRSYENLIGDGYDSDVGGKKAVSAEVYDPLFVMSVLGQSLAQEKVFTGFEILDILRTNALGCTICCLSSRSTLVRSAAIVLICKTYAFVQAAVFHEKAQVLLILESLRNCIGMDLGDGCSVGVPLPLTTTLFVAHALRAQSLPSLYLYPLFSRFMLQRAAPLDKSDIPLLYSFLYASSQQTQTHRQQRIFIIRYMTSCVLYGGRTEWRTMKRRHVWHILSAMYTTLLMRDDLSSEESLRRAIEEFWEAAMQRERVALDVICRLGFLQFLEQMQDITGQGASKFAHCLFRLISNLFLSCSLTRLHRATRGTVFATLLRLFPMPATEVSNSVSFGETLRFWRATEKVTRYAQELPTDAPGRISVLKLASAWCEILEQPMVQRAAESGGAEELQALNEIKEVQRRTVSDINSLH